MKADEFDKKFDENEDNSQLSSANTKPMKINYVSAFIEAFVDALVYLIW